MKLDCGCDTLGEKCAIHRSPYDLIICPTCGYDKAARLWGSGKLVCEGCGKGM